MPRSGRLRSFIRDYRGSPRFEKLSFILPFLILIVEGVLLAHALTIDASDIMVVELTTVLLAISLVEIIFVTREIHDHYQRSNFDKILTIKLDDFILKSKKNNVKKIVEDFIELYPKYKKHRNEIYHTSCQIMETHKEEYLEKELTNRLKVFIKKTKETNVDGILETFIKKYPSYKKYRSEIYKKTCQIFEKTRK
jgi:hypothetical protein